MLGSKKVRLGQTDVLHLKRKILMSTSETDGTKKQNKLQAEPLSNSNSSEIKLSLSCSSGSYQECSSWPHANTHSHQRAHIWTSLQQWTRGSSHPVSFWSERSPAQFTARPPCPVKAQEAVSVDELHHSSTRFFRMISRTSAVTSRRTLSMGSSVRQNRTTFPSGFTRNFQKFHLGIFCTESET